ncbi:MAG: hypothetical protein KDC43_27445 [Saprospiraceae bacterium]|nr:hypothetical protein [Saprospiraceae bacterium]
MQVKAYPEKFLDARQFGVLMGICKESDLRARKALFKTIFLPLLIPVLFGIGALEYAVMLEIFAEIFAPEPGVTAPEHNYYLFAATSLVIILALHAVSLKSKNGSVDRAFTTVVSLVLPIVILGIGLVFGAIVWANGGSDLGISSLESDILGAFTDRLEEASPGIKEFFERQILPYFGVIFSASLGFIFLISAFVGHTLISAIKSIVEEFADSRSSKKAANQNWNEINQTHQIYTAKVRKFDRMANDLDGDERDAAKLIALDVQEAIRPIAKLITARKLAPSPTEAQKLVLKYTDGIHPEMFDWDLGILIEFKDQVEEVLTIDRIHDLIRSNRH